jgi:hypothetical protein
MVETPTSVISTTSSICVVGTAAAVSITDTPFNCLHCLAELSNAMVRPRALTRAIPRELSSHALTALSVEAEQVDLLRRR